MDKTGAAGINGKPFVHGQLDAKLKSLVELLADFGKSISAEVMMGEDRYWEIDGKLTGNMLVAIYIHRI